MKLQLRLFLALSLAAILGTALTLTLTSGETPEELGYVGQETCMQSGCHADYENKIYQGADEFRKTMHQNIHLRPTPENVVIDSWFAENRVLRFWDNRLQGPPHDTMLIELSKGELETDYYIQMRFSGPEGDSTPRMKVQYTYGGQGWLQRFLVEINGNLHVAPFQYVLPEYRSTSDTGLVYFLDNKRWYLKNANIDRFEFFDFNSNRFREQSWDKNCSACHVNGFNIQIDSFGVDNQEKKWTALWAGKLSGDSAMRDQNILIGCESCHGPGSVHSENPTDDNIISPGNWARTVEGTDRKLDMCNQCHNRHSSTLASFSYPYDEANDQPYIPGLPLKDYVKDMKSGRRVWGDGETSSAHHQTGQDYVRSVPYEIHLFKDGCWDCHTVHHNEPGLPFMMDRDWYTMEEGEGCLAFGCHNDFAATELREGVEINLHSQHSQGVSQCVNCHFTKTATITFVGTHEFSDHSFKVLRPKATIDLRDNGFAGMINTCAESCHRNGRGSRNRNPSDPVAPDYGITDLQLYFFNEETDLALADSLWQGYKELYPDYVSAVRVSGESVTTSGITSATPNPIRSKTTVSFRIARRGEISLQVYDINGKRIRTLAEGNHAAGTYTQVWDGSNEANRLVPNGTYFIRLNANGEVSSRKVVITR